MGFVKAQHQCFWPSSGLFSSADQFLMLPSCQHTLLVSGCPQNAHLDAAGGHSAGLRSLNHPAWYAPEGASSTCCLFFRAGEAAWAFFLLWNVMPSSLKASVLVTVENTTSSWDLNQASCSWPPSGDLQACAGGSGQIVPDPAFLFVVFLSSNDWRKWVNSAFRKTPLFKNCRCERLFLLYIFKIEIYNPLSALLLTLVCHFYYVLLRVAIFVLNVAIATYFERRQKELSTKTLLWKIYRGKVVQFFTAQPLSGGKKE